MNGNEIITVDAKGISFPNFYYNPIINFEEAIDKDDTGWDYEVGFTIGERIANHNLITINITAKLIKKSDETEISSLEIESNYDVSAPIDMPQLHKFNLLNRLLNTVVGQLQGAWVAKQTYENYKLVIPHISLNDESIVEDLKKQIQEKWE